MNWQQVKTDWNKVSGKFHTRWSKLTNEDLSAIAGKRVELVDRIQKLYFLDKGKAEKEAEDFIKNLH